MRLAPALVAAALLSGCGYVGFGRGVTTDEMILQQEIRSFYNDVQRAFTVSNPDALASLFDPSITHPMTHAEIKAWGEKFFGEHKDSRFKIEKLEFNELGYLQAVVTLTYKVETPDGKGGFGGTEEDKLVKRRKRWYVASWDKVPAK